MATDGPPHEGLPPPPREEVHLPGASYLPVIVAAAVTVVIIGIVIAWFLVLIGAVVFVVATVRWIREVREEMSELPLEH